MAHPTFICAYACRMMASIGCRMDDQMVYGTPFERWLRLLFLEENDEFVYFLFERLRRLALSTETHFVNLITQVSPLILHYNTVYLKSIYYDADQSWTNYVRIPWFCLTPTRLIVKPFKFMQSNRVFRYVPNIRRSMAFVEFRDDTESAFLSTELSPLLDHYLRQGIHFGGRHYVYLHHAQSQIRQKQFYFYCEEEGGMTREAIEAWMGNFDAERIPAKNTARRTQPFSSTEATIEASIST